MATTSKPVLGAPAQAESVVSLPSDYRQFFSTVGSFNANPNLGSAVDFNTFKSNQSAYKAPSVKSVFAGGYTLGKPASVASRYQGVGNSPIASPTASSLSFGAQLQPTTSAQDNYNAYKSGFDTAYETSRSNDIANFLKSANPGMDMSMLKHYWTSAPNQTSIRDRMPSADGVNFADEYMKGTNADQFYQEHPDLVPQLHSGVGLATGFSGRGAAGETSPGSSFAAPKDSFGSAYQSNDFLRGRDSVDSSIMKGPGYATGGQIGSAPLGADSAGLTPQGQQIPVNAQMLDANVQDVLRRNPQAAAQVKQAVDQAFASGEITAQQAHMVVQLAQAALNNPALWPQLRQWAIQNGLAQQNEVPQNYDQGLVVAILSAAKSYEHGGGQQAGISPGQGAGMQKQGFATGGQIQGPGSGTSDSIPAVNASNGQHIKVSDGEFIIPEHVVRAKGTEFFESLINKYNQQEQQ